MALIRISDVSVDKRDNAALEGGYLYKDLFLDLEPNVYYNKQLNKQVILKDVQGSYDLQAIKNSIINIFLTSPGQKILNPEFGLGGFTYYGLEKSTETVFSSNFFANILAYSLFYLSLISVFYYSFLFFITHFLVLYFII